jgi:hypothetical protein
LLQPPVLPPWSALAAFETLVVGWSALLLTLQAIGGGDALSRVAHEFAPPRLSSLRRMRMLVGLITASLGIGGTVCYVLLVPPAELAAWTSTPRPGRLSPTARLGPGAFAIALAGAAVLLLVPGVFPGRRRSAAAAALDRGRSGRLVELHRRFSTQCA